MSEKLCFNNRISRRSAYEMIILFAKRGNHPFNVKFKTDKDVIRYFANRGVDFQNLVATCRDPKSNVPNFENAIGSTWQTGGDGKVSLVDKITREEEVTVQGPGDIITSKYRSLIEDACEARDRAVEKGALSEFLTATTKGVASIEAYLRHRVSIWNRISPRDLIGESRQDRLSIDQMVDQWVPKISGKKLVKSWENWSDFKKLQKHRHDDEVHPKATAYGIEFPELANLLNLLRTGIAGLQIDLHVLFKERIPREIIRMAYAPDVTVIDI